MVETNNTETTETIIDTQETETTETTDTVDTTSPANSFLDGLDVSYRNDPNINKFESGDALAKGYTELSKMLGQDKVVLPKEGENYDAQMDELMTKLGMPENAEGYGLQDIDLKEQGIDAVIPVGEFSKVARDLRMTPTQVQGVLDYYKEDIINNNAQSAEQVNDAVNTAKVELRKEYGAAYEANMQAASGVFKNHFPSLEGTDLANNPQFVRDLVKLSKNFGETKLGEAPKGGAMSPAEASAEKSKLMNSPAYTNQLDPEHDSVVEKVRTLREMEMAV